MPARTSHALSWLAIDVACLTLGLAGTALAQVRLEPSVAETVSRDTNQLRSALFGPDGYFLLAGGVVLHGSAHFMVEQGGQDQPVPALSVTPVAEPGGRMALQANGRLYQVGVPAGLACPLGRFVERDGLIAYTVMRYMTPDSPRALQRAGLVRHRLAREFDGTPWETLLRAADFAETTKLPNGEGAAIAASINASNGSDAFVLRTADSDEIGSYINSDLQVTYRVFLMAGAQRVEIAGVPLRYYWLLDRAGQPAVFSVEATAQDWPADARLTDWRVPGAHATQYDVVNFYQVAGMLRALQLTSPDTFAAFVEKACQE
jgi:hypothetical protein